MLNLWAELLKLPSFFLLLRFPSIKPEHLVEKNSSCATQPKRSQWHPAVSRVQMSRTQ